MATTIGSLLIDLAANVAGLRSDLDKAVGHVQSFSAQSNKALALAQRGYMDLKRTLASLGVGFSLAIVARETWQLVEATAKANAELSGEKGEQARAFNAALHQLGEDAHFAGTRIAEFLIPALTTLMNIGRGAAGAGLPDLSPFDAELRAMQEWALLRQGIRGPSIARAAPNAFGIGPFDAVRAQAARLKEITIEVAEATRQADLAAQGMFGAWRPMISGELPRAILETVNNFDELAQSVTEINPAWNEWTASIDTTLEELDQLAQSISEYREEWTAFAAAPADAMAEFDRLAQSIDDGTAQAAAATAELRAQYEAARASAAAFSSIVAGGLADAIVNGRNLNDVLRQIALRLAEAAIQAMLFRSAMAGLGYGGGFGVIPAPVPAPSTGPLGNDFYGAGRAGLTQNITIDARGADATVEARIMRALDRARGTIVREAVAATADARRRRLV